MNTIDKLCALLDEKKELFLRYRQATEGLLECTVDSAEQYITEREMLANEIDAKNEEIARVCADVPAAELLLGAAHARVDFDQIPNEYHCVFYGGQGVRSVISQIMESEKRAAERLQHLRSQALQGVKQNKEIPKIKKYLSDLAEPPVQGGLRNEKA